MSCVNITTGQKYLFEAPRQVEAVNLAGNRRGTPLRDVVRRGGPLPAREVRGPAPKPPPPLLTVCRFRSTKNPPGRGSVRRYQDKTA